MQRCLARQGSQRATGPSTSGRPLPVAAPCRSQRPIWTQRRICARATPVWDDSMTLGDLKAHLDAAVDAEDYDLAARIRDTLQ